MSDVERVEQLLRSALVPVEPPGGSPTGSSAASRS